MIQGWWHYYAAFHPTVMLNVYRHINYALERWARRKYKTLFGKRRRSAEWLRKMRDAYPSLFHHWQVIGTQVG